MNLEFRIVNIELRIKKQLRQVTLHSQLYILNSKFLEEEK
jgi:hypothetical protein